MHDQQKHIITSPRLLREKRLFKDTEGEKKKEDGAGEQVSLQVVIKLNYI